MLQVTARAYVGTLARGETCNFYIRDGRNAVVAHSDIELAAAS